MASRFARTAGEYQMSRNSLIDSASCRRISSATELRRSDLMPANAGGFAFASVADPIPLAACNELHRSLHAGVPAHEAIAVSGHRTRSVFDRYAISTDRTVRTALERVDEYLEQQAAKQ